MAFTYPSLTQVIRTDTFDTWANKTNEIRGHSLYVQALIGDFNELNTDSKNIVGAFNEHETLINKNIENIGPLPNLYDVYEGANIVESINNAYDTLINYVDTEVANEASLRILGDNNLANQIDVVEIGAGLSENGTYVQNTNTNYISNATSLANADFRLDAKIKVEADILNNTQQNIGTDSSGNITLSGSYISGTVKNSLVALDAQAFSNKTRIDGNVSSISTLDTRLTRSQTSLGLTTTGYYTSDSGNTYATTNNVKGDINAIDVKLENVDVALQTLIDEDANIYVELAKKLEVPPSPGDNLIVYDAGTYTYSHATNNSSSVNTSGSQIIDRINLDAAGHITSMGTRNLGNQSQHNQTISSNLPSGGSNGDVWYRV